MKGIIFNLLEEFITENLGESAYEKILEQCQLTTQEPFVGPGSYPDEDLMAIAGKTIETMGVTADEALRAFGRFCFPRMVGKYPEFVNPFNHPKPFLKSIDSVVHVEVKKLYKDAEPPCFVYEDPADDTLVIKYSSKRKLCKFMEGLIDGVADHFKSPIQYEQSSCKHDGAENCHFELKFL